MAPGGCRWHRRGPSRLRVARRTGIRRVGLSDRRHRIGGCVRRRAERNRVVLSPRATQESGGVARVCQYCFSVALCCMGMGLDRIVDRRWAIGEVVRLVVAALDGAGIVVCGLDRAWEGGGRRWGASGLGRCRMLLRRAGMSFELYGKWTPLCFGALVGRNAALVGDAKTCLRGVKLGCRVRAPVGDPEPFGDRLIACRRHRAGRALEHRGIPWVGVGVGFESPPRLVPSPPDLLPWRKPCRTKRKLGRCARGATSSCATSARGDPLESGCSSWCSRGGSAPT